MTALSLQ